MYARSVNGLIAVALLSVALADDARAACGDDVLEAGEQCDNGSANGSDGCCSSSCTLVDADADGICDLYDLCASPLIEAPRIVNFDGTSGRVSQTFHGRLTVPFPFSPPLDPAVNGVRFLVIDRQGDQVLDRTLEGGSNWRVNGSRTQWRYERRASSGNLSIKATIKDLSRSRPGVVKVSLKRNAAAAFPSPPLIGSVFLHPPDGSQGQCGQASPPCVRQKDNLRTTCR